MAPPSGERTPVVRAYDWRTDSPTFAVIDAIAHYEDAEPARLAEHLPALQHTLDTDALQAISKAPGGLACSFMYAGYHVRITNETVSVTRSRPTPH